MLNKKFFLGFLLLILPFNVKGAENEIWLNDIKVENLEEIYHNNDYDNHIPLPSYQIPPIFLKKFPSDFNSISDETYRAHMFIKILSPLAIKINDEILKERSEIFRISDEFKKSEKLSDKDNQIVENLAEKYDVFTRLKDKERTNLLLRELTEKTAEEIESIYTKTIA